MLKKIRAFVLISAIGLNCLPLAAQTNRQLEQENSGQTEKRIALVIGNGAYQKAKPLTNPANDATDMAAMLKGLGFEVLSGVNLNKQQMEKLIRDFGNKLVNGGTGLFYYAGHGIQVGGENYLVPVDADIPEEDEVSYSAVPINLVLRKMSTANNDLNIVILDACRNNPFARSWRGFRDGSSSDGLAKISPPTGTLVLYATEPGKVASDGAGKNGLFTEALLKQIKKPNLEYDQMVRALSADVWQKSNKQQLPWKEGNSLSDFYFVKTDAKIPPATPTKTEPLKDETLTARDKASIEREAWSYIKNSTDAPDFRDFLKDFPDGANAANAKIKLEQAVWDAVKDSKDKAKIQTYLTEFPLGANAPLARIKLRQLDVSATPANTSDTTSAATKTAGAVSKAILPGNVEMSFAYIPAGNFEMGSNDDDANEKPIHTVKISKGFWLGQTEVTQAQWKAIMGVLPSKCDYGGKLKGDSLGDSKPIICVNWDDAQEFVLKLNLKNDGYKYRLPTEAEWEYAARSGTTGNYAGDLDSMAWYSGNAGGHTHDVATKTANAWNLYDMHGNVWEWTADWYGSYPSGTVTDPTSAANDSHRVDRGGSWSSLAGRLRSANRGYNTPSLRYFDLGFRLLRE